MLAIKAWRRHTHVPGVADSFAQLKIITHLRCIENQLLVATGTTLSGAVLTSFLMICLARVGKMSGMAVEKNGFQPSCVTRHSSFQCSIDSLQLITMVSADSVRQRRNTLDTDGVR